MFLFVQSLMQFYHFKRRLSAVLLVISGWVLPSHIHSQPVDNKLFIINSASQYRSWLSKNKGLNLVPLKESIKPLYHEVFYATSNNFTGRVLYKNPELYLCQEAATRLSSVQDSLLTIGLSILVYDAYRPYAVTEKMWKIVPDERYAANPKNGSGHNRGVSIDLTLADARTGEPLEMPTRYDHFSDSAHHGFPGIDLKKAANRDLLKNIMEHFGFVALSTEWWHYSLPNAKRFPILNLSFKKLSKL
jgi:D-alanyl-D-alanine dipeptidase